MTSAQAGLPSLSIFAAIVCLPPALFLMVCLRRRAHVQARRRPIRGITILAVVALAFLVFNIAVTWFAGPGPLAGEPAKRIHWIAFGVSWISLWGWIVVGARRLFRRRYVL